MMTTKAFFYFFVLMTILNLPIMWLYFSAQIEDIPDASLTSILSNPFSRFLQDEETASIEGSAFQDVLDIIDKTSIGNIGRFKAGCYEVDLDQPNDSPFLSCAMGTMTISENTIRVGTIGAADTGCTSDLSESGALLSNCSGSGLFADDGWDSFIEALDVCQNQAYCTFDSTILSSVLKPSCMPE